MTTLFEWNKLERFCAALFERGGLPAADARLIAESLVQAELRGIDSHGVIRTDIYMKRLESGMINTDGRMTVRASGPITLLDGSNHFGAVVGNKALELAVQSASEHGIGVVGVKGSNHFGICANYLLKAVRQDLIMIVMSNASQTMPPTGGIRPFIGTNPFSIGIPAGRHPPFILDMATSVVARGKIIAAAQKGEPIPEGWAVDKRGNPTQDAQEALEGSVLPVGGAKGYGISMFIDILSGVLTGAGFGKYVNNMYENWQEPQNVGHFFIGFDIRRFMPVEQFKARIDRYFDEIKAEPTAPATSEIYIPGELEHRSSMDRMKAGIGLPAKVVEELRYWGERYRVDLAEALLVPKE